MSFSVRLPIGIEAQTIRSSLSGDGILTVEAQLPNIPKTQMVIPVQVNEEKAMACLIRNHCYPKIHFLFSSSDCE